MNIDHQKYVFKIYSGTKSTGKKGTAFLISPKYALTARHNLSPKNIKTVKLEIEGSLKIANVMQNNYKDVDAVLLELVEEIKGFNIPELDTDFDILDHPSAKWEAYGFPGMYQKYFKGDKLLRASKSVYWDIDIDITNTIENYKGLSGAPVLVNNKIIGLITTSVPNDQLGVISIKLVSPILDFDTVKENNQININEVHAEEMDWNSIQEKCKRNKYYYLNIKEFQLFLTLYPNGKYKKKAEETINSAQLWYEMIKTGDFLSFKRKYPKTIFTLKDFENRFYYLALKNIWVHGDTDIFPLPFETRIFKDRTSDVIEALVEIDRKFGKHVNKEEDKLFVYELPEKSLINTAIPIGYTGFRWASQIEPIWNAYYLSLVLRIASEIEKQRTDSDFSQKFFSYRFDPDYIKGDIFKKRKGLQFSSKTENLLIKYFGINQVAKIIKEFGNKIYSDEKIFEKDIFRKLLVNKETKEKIISASRIKVSDWLEFQRYSYDLVKSNNNYKYIVSCDIADFYNRINHTDLFETLNKWNEVKRKLEALLSLFSKGKSYSLPIGGNASRILAENLLFDFDYYLNDAHIEFSRFVDDYYLFAKTEDEANKVLNNFYTYLLNSKGLSLQKHKIQIFTRAEFLTSIETRLFWKSDDKDTKDKARVMALARFDYFSEIPDDEEVEDPINIEKLINEELRKSRIHEQLANRLLSELNHTPNINEDHDDFNYNISKAYYSIFHQRTDRVEKDKLLKLYPIFRKLLISIKYNIQNNRLITIKEKFLLRGIEKESSINLLDLVLSRLADLYRNKSYVFDVDLHIVYFLYILTKISKTEISSYLITEGKNSTPLKLKQFFKDEYGSSKSSFVKSWLLINLLVIGEDSWFKNNINNYQMMDYWEKRIFILSAVLMESIGEDKILLSRLTDFEKIIFDWGKEIKLLSEFKKLI